MREMKQESGSQFQVSTVLRSPEQTKKGGGGGGNVFVLMWHTSHTRLETEITHLCLYPSILSVASISISPRSNRGMEYERDETRVGSQFQVSTVLRSPRKKEEGISLYIAVACVSCIT